MAKIVINGEEYELEEITAGEDLHVTQESTTWDRATNRPRVNIETYTFGLALASLKSWTRKDSEGKRIPINRETVGALPRTLFAKILSEVNKVNFPEQAANFRE